eukprot:2754038-Prymnesium_polylepis.1
MLDTMPCRTSMPPAAILFSLCLSSSLQIAPRATVTNPAGTPAATPAGTPAGTVLSGRVCTHPGYTRPVTCV